MEAYLDRMTELLERQVKLPGGLCVALPTAVVFCVAAAANLIGVLGGAILFFPDSATYLESAYILLAEGSFRGVTPFKLPGYTLFVAPFLALFGKHAILALVVGQHVLTTVVPVIVAKIGYELWKTRWLGFIAGTMSALSLQLQGYARIPMTEVLFTILVVSGLLFALRYLRTGSLRPFLAATAMFALATLVRSVAQYMFVLLIVVPAAQAAFPRWRFLFSEMGGTKSWRHLRVLVAGIAVYGALVTPWMVRNLQVYDYFGFTPVLGVNLFSNVIEFAEMHGKPGIRVNEDSPAVAEIKKRFAEYVTAPSERKYTWKNHMVSFDRYRAASGKSHREADAVFLRAAMDTILADPGGYAWHVILNAYQSMVWNALPYVYVPGVRAGAGRPWYASVAESVDEYEAPRQWVHDIVGRHVEEEANPVHWRSPTPFTPVYAAMATAYYAVHEHGYRLFQVFVLGVAISVAVMFRERSVRWLWFLLLLAYSTTVPFLVVPAASRHRLSADPMIDIILALTVIFAALAVVKTWGIVRKRWRSVNNHHDFN